MGTRPFNPRFRLAAVLAAAMMFSVFTATVSACPNCKASLPNGSSADGSGVAEPNVAQGYAWSIYLFLAVPFVLVTTLSATAFVLVRKASARTKMRTRSSVL